MDGHVRTDRYHLRGRPGACESVMDQSGGRKGTSLLGSCAHDRMGSWIGRSRGRMCNSLPTALVRALGVA